MATPRTAQRATGFGWGNSAYPALAAPVVYEALRWLAPISCSCCGRWERWCQAAEPEVVPLPPGHLSASSACTLGCGGWPDMNREDCNHDRCCTFPEACCSRCLDTGLVKEAASIQKGWPCDPKALWDAAAVLFPQQLQVWQRLRRAASLASILWQRSGELNCSGAPWDQTAPSRKGPSSCDSTANDPKPRPVGLRRWS